MKNVNASIITIGDELLIGQTIDTNSAFIAQELNKIGVWVHRNVTVGDVYDEIWKALDDESNRSDIVIITGGLGPTADDITKPLLCKYFGGKLIVNEKVLEHIKYLFEKIYRRPGPILERNLKQAEVPDVCTVLHNPKGTAPGMLFKKTIFKAPLYPPQGGTFDPDRNNIHYSYMTSDPTAYGILKKFVAKHRAHPTEAEKALWEIIKGRKLSGYKFRRQHIIDKYIADFVCLPQRLIIEIDGLIHQIPDNKISDDARTLELKIKGFDVIRFTNSQILNDADSVVNRILQELKKEKAESPELKNPPLEGREANIKSPELNNPPLEGREADIKPLEGREANIKLLEGSEVMFISLPGVPYEMKGIFINEVIPRLLKEFKFPAIIHRTAFTAGQGESMIAELLKDFEPALPPHVKLAYLPNYGMVKLRLTATGDNKKELEKELASYFEMLQEKVKEYLVSDQDEALEAVVGRILKQKNKTIGTAESCTGGYIAHLITSIPGSSAYFKGSVVSYANDAKENILGVQPSTLDSVGAVSEETVKEMLRGVIHALHVDYAIATSGIMGPDGGTPEKPVGTVWIAVGNKESIETLQLQLRFDRLRNIAMTAATALNFLRKFIVKN